VRVNPKTRDSRLFTSIGGYVRRSLGTMARVYLLYRPLGLFFAISGVFVLAALVLFVRFVYLYLVLHPLPTGHTQSLVVAGVLAVIGVLFGALGILSDLIAMNRRLLEEVVFNTRYLRIVKQGADEEKPR
jgi:hypothetical protein